MLYRDRYQNLYDIKRKRIPATPDEALRLQRLERPLPWPKEIWPPDQHIERYPCYPPLIEKIADHEGLLPGNIVLGQGIEDFIRTLVLLSCDPGDGFAFTWPTCAMFELYAQIFSATAHPIVTDPRRPPSAEEIASYAGISKLLLLPNPGQPVETVYGLEELRMIAQVCERYETVFAVDEAYYGFGGPTALPLIEEFDNVVVLRTFSKAFGAAGIRVGYAMGQHAVIQPLDAIRTSGEIAGPSLLAATKLLDNYEQIVVPGIRDVVNGRDWLREKLRELGYQAEGSWANHVLITMETTSQMQAVVAEMKRHGVYVKGGYPAPLDRHILVTAGPAALMKQFLAVFTEACNRSGRS